MGDTKPQDFDASVTANVQRALSEDVGTGDITAMLIDSSKQSTARVITRQPGVFCGKPWVEEICRQLDSNIEVRWSVNDGDAVEPDQELFLLKGSARTLLTLERTILNFVQLLSGTATLTRRYVELMGNADSKLLDTRKTIPGLRLAQKYAVRCGGGHNHRLGLFDAFLIKENHISAAGGISQAVLRARSLHPEIPVQVEVENLTELNEAMRAGANIALIDNFSLADTKTAVTASRGTLKLEASGGIDEKTIKDIAATGVDYISIGNLTKQVLPLDLSMRFMD
ncbi:MAG: carboxylating nicotinate-nucleotide diphosphorylase [Gammaproteobacteria bacterium]|nr:carboxylating nicotinate-nucleotide diphosphorylase [Gammaproteobacteria bacterium]MCZ6854679.1 carboxylating nicotinate-nucleotide diphosphorylase [Gammaproteobacteria bacterium]